MYYPYQADFFQNIEYRIRELEKNNELLKNENLQLRQQLEQMKPIHIENINYKIQELVVRELKGTLNIGMTALSDAEQIKELLANTGSTENDEELVLEDLAQGNHNLDENGGDL